MKKLDYEEKDFITLLRKYPTDKLLEYFSNKSLEIDGGVKLENPITLKNRTRIFKTNLIVIQWELTQICYYSIKYSNDYRNKDIELGDFYRIFKTNKRYDESMEMIEIDNMDYIKIEKHMQCLTNVQFDYQRDRMISKFNRIFKIMYDINSNISYIEKSGSFYINFSEKFKEITKVEMKKFIKVWTIITLYSLMSKISDVNIIADILENYKDNIGITKEELWTIINYYSKDYEYYKKSNNWNVLRYYPVVRTKKNERYIITNIASLMNSLPDIPYWIIRNYYKDLNKRDFTSYFGMCFEYYLNDLFNFYNINAEKLKENGKNKIPDWKIETDNYTILVEQKASLFPIDARVTTKYERYESIEKYFENIVKAFKQLNSFSTKENKKVIKMCLTYEKIHMPENAQDIINNEFNVDMSLDWIVNIDEFESLMQILKENEEKFNRIIEEKISLEKNNSKDGRSFEKILGKVESDYALNEINYFDKFIEELQVRKE